MALTKDEKLAILGQRSISAGRSPIDEFKLEPLPDQVLKAFPTLADWEKRNNARLNEFVSKMNTVIPI